MYLKLVFFSHSTSYSVLVFLACEGRDLRPEIYLSNRSFLFL